MYGYDTSLTLVMYEVHFPDLLFKYRLAKIDHIQPFFNVLHASVFADAATFSDGPGMDWR